MDLEEQMLSLKFGRREALGEIYRLSKRAVYLSAFAVLRNKQDAEDVTQDAFVRVCEQIGRYKPKGTPLGWICAIVKNLARTAIKKRKRFVPLESAEELAAEPLTDSSGILELAAKVLNEKELAVVLLKTNGDLDHKQIADITKTTYATVRWQYHSAIEKLKKFIEKENIVL